jgi:hypothetical protein
VELCFQTPLPQPTAVLSKACRVPGPCLDAVCTALHRTVFARRLKKHFLVILYSYMCVSSSPYLFCASSVSFTWNYYSLYLFRAFTKLRKVTISFVVSVAHPPVCLSTWYNSAHTNFYDI